MSAVVHVLAFCLQLCISQLHGACAFHRLHGLHPGCQLCSSRHTVRGCIGQHAL